MFKREPRKGYVFVTVELPSRLAEIISKHGNDLIHVIEAISQECNRLPPPAEVQAEIDKKYEQKRFERAAYLKSLGRTAYRLLRHRIEADNYITSTGTTRSRNRQNHQEWRKQVLSDVALELSESNFLIEFVVVRFRKELLAKIKPRRERTIIRLYLEGAFRREIAAYVNVSKTTIDNFLKANHDHLRKLYFQQAPTPATSFAHREIVAPVGLWERGGEASGFIPPSPRLLPKVRASKAQCYFALKGRNHPALAGQLPAPLLTVRTGGFLNIPSHNTHKRKE